MKKTISLLFLIPFKIKHQVQQIHHSKDNSKIVLIFLATLQNLLLH